MMAVKQIILSSLIVILVVLSLLVLMREQIKVYLIGDTVIQAATEASPATVTHFDHIPDMIARVNEAVVSIVVTKDVPVYERYFDSINPFGDWFGFSVPRIRENGTEEREVGGGSGFIVTTDGMVVTNRHVVSDDSARYSVIMKDGTSYEVEVLAKDPVLDIAILQIKNAPTTLPTLRFGDSDTVRLGETVVAIGNALAEFRNSVSVGIISGLSRSIEATDGSGVTEQLSNVFQTDAAINPGNSGGPLLNQKGEVIGVNVAATMGAENIAFAIPSAAVAAVVKSVEEYGTIKRPFLGIRYAMVTKRMIEQNNLAVDYGAVIVRGEGPDELAVMPGSPADVAGLRENDILLKINDEELRETDLATVLRAFAPGETIRVEVWSQGTIRSVELTLTAVSD
ncbi:MAG: hypothetical protein RLZZ70_576 [Candidatus Parcubacteria bacterium]|jgi:S1-C subfamily serine protease